MRKGDKAGKAYWEKNWEDVPLPSGFALENQNLGNYVNLKFHDFFLNEFQKERDFSVLEIGCANSVWPFYFYKNFGAKIFGLDYSEKGCENIRRMLALQKVPGEIYQADLFEPPQFLLEKFDVVFSFGVAEHFEDTAACLKACAALVKPGGRLITFIPNMTGLIGVLQKWVDVDIYNIHVPLTREAFIKAHEDANLSLDACDYFLAMNLNVVNSGKFSQNFLNPYFRRFLSMSSKIVWWLEKKGIAFPKTRFFSPYIFAVSRITESHSL